MKRVVNFIKNIPDEVVISKREFLLTIVACVLGGIVFGMLGSPRKTQIFGSNNGNGWVPVSGDEDEEIFDED